MGMHNSSQLKLIQVGDLCDFSALAYNDNITLADDWQLFLDSVEIITERESEFYRGKAFIKIMGKGNDFIKIDCVISHRGTDLAGLSLKTLDELRQDIEVFYHKTPDQFKLGAIPFMNAIFDKFKSVFKEKNCLVNFICTGHSLGAILSDLSSFWIKDYIFSSGNGNIIYAQDSRISVTFENPGSEPIIGALLEKDFFSNNIKSDIQFHLSLLGLYPYMRVFNADVNAINTINKQFGTVYGPCIYGYDFEGTPDDVPYELYYFFHYTIGDQHKLINLQKFFKKYDASFLAPTSFWPIGFHGGYKQYLSYLDRKVYWDSLIKYLWEHYDHIKKNYLGNFTKYHDAFVSVLNSNMVDLV